jgi:hypothetical protein
VSDGAGQVSGAPWHMRTLQLDGTGNKNQDRSIQPSAIVGELPPFALAPPTPTPRPTTAPAPRPTSPALIGPSGPTTPGAPAIQAGDPPGFPTVTIPPTSTGPPVDADDPARAAMVAAVLGTSAVILLMLVPLLRRRPSR